MQGQGLSEPPPPTQPHAAPLPRPGPGGCQGTAGGSRGGGGPGSGQPRQAPGPPRERGAHGALPGRPLPSRRHHRAGFHGNSEPRPPRLPLLCNAQPAGRRPRTAPRHPAPRPAPRPVPRHPPSALTGPRGPKPPRPHGTNTDQLHVAEPSRTTGCPGRCTALTCRHHRSTPKPRSRPPRTVAPARDTSDTRAGT